MSAVATIERVLETDLLLPDLSIIPERGATDAEITAEQALLGGAFHPAHVALLKRWNGIDLEVIRLFGCGEETGEIGRIADQQLDVDSGVDGAIVIGSDASGFTYVQAGDGRILCFDSDGGEIKKLASDLDDLMARVVFGPDAANFGGDDWLEELREGGIVN